MNDMSRNPQHGQRPQTPSFRPAPDAKSALQAFDDDESPEQPKNEAPLWRSDMQNVPRDGSLVALLVAHGAPEYKLARWGRWRKLIISRWRQQEGWLADVVRKPMLGFEPVAWARYDAMLGPVRAE